MEREILFRGKRVKDGKWVEGLLTKDIKGHIRIQYNPRNFSVVVNPETVGQFTGMTDKNGTKIFEGDIVRHIDTTRHVVEVVNSEVYFDTEMLEFGVRYSNELFHCKFNDEFEVIGNIYDNKELVVISLQNCIFGLLATTRILRFEILTQL